jgi:alkanesulfonate monooxygenase SsuD/methylene tetrahydromethanopterin reductase-like flavin-dependent oxidoreductase (luciferase family)
MSGVPESTALTFGVFDHLDRGSVPLPQHYENRLKLAEVYDREGFHAYHIAEHHSTPLGMASAPGIFLAAVAQRTQRLRFGPLVYALSLTHPLRLIEEICMLDQMSQGRLELGVGRGSSPYEMSYFGVQAQESGELYKEAYAVILQGLTSPVLNFQGSHYTFDNVPMELTCVQKPHPPIWYGLSAAAAAPWAAEHGVNIVCNGPARPVHDITDRYREVWSQHHGGGHLRMPFLGLGRHIVVAETHAEAYALGERGFAHWYNSLQHLWRAHGNPMKSYPIPEDFSQATAGGMVIVGTPEQVTEQLHAEVEKAGATYVLTRFAFGDLSYEESRRSLDLFCEQVMPQFAAQPCVA